VDPQLRELLQSSPDDAVFEAVVRLKPGRPPPQGLTVVASFGTVRTARIAKRALPRVYAHPDVVSVKAARPVGPADAWVEPDGPGEPERESQRDRAEHSAGAGVVVACLDWGLDYVNSAFRDAAGNTRLLALWDQRGPTGARGAARYGYGTIYERPAIQRSLAAQNPYRALGYHPTRRGGGNAQFHGTHCLDVAAGTPRGEAAGGVAHRADLVFVHLAAGGGADLADLGDSVRLLEALDFVTRVAGDRPIVCSASLGRTGGTHLGSSPIDLALEAWLTPGRAWCGSAGNYFAHSCHASGLLRAGRPAELDWVVPPLDRTENELEVFLSNRDIVRVEITAPGASSATSVELGGERDIVIGGRVVGRAYHRAYDPEAKHHIDIFLHAAAPAGAWSVRLVPLEIVDGRYHAWVERDSNASVQSRLQNADPRYTLGTLANGYSTFIVGAYDRASGQLAAYSSSGPTADGRLAKPDLIAPGNRIVAARAALPDEPPGRGGVLTLSGTSMATPRVAGVVAAMFSIVPRKLRIAETRRLLLGACVRAPHLDRLRSGAGYLDEAAALRAAATFSRELETRSAQDGRGERNNGTMDVERKLRLIEAAVGMGHDVALGHRRVTAAALGRAWSPSELFDLTADVAADGVRELGRAGQVPTFDLAAGDVLVRRARGARMFDHVAVLADPRLLTVEQLLRQGARLESAAPGLYGLVIEGGARPHRAQDGFWRRILELDGRVADGQLLLRAADADVDRDASEQQAVDPNGPRRVPASRVSCASLPPTHPVIQRIGTADPVGALRDATRRALEILDAAIARVDAMRTRIAAGEATSVVDQPLADAMWRRLRLRPRRRQTWLESGPGSVGLVLRWLRNLRRILDGGLNYTCLGTECRAGDFALVVDHGPHPVPLTPHERYRIFLCERFWRAGEDDRALTLIHEASHIYYVTEDRGGGPGAAECLTQFVGDLAGVPVTAGFAAACPPPTGPVPADAFEDSGAQELDFGVDFDVDEVEQVADPNYERRVRANRVSCGARPPTHPVIQRIGTTNPVGALRDAAARAVALIDGAVARVEATRQRIASGEATSSVEADLGTALWERLRLNPRRRATWLGRGPGTVEIVVRWLRNIRNLLDGGHLKYTCLASENCSNALSWVYSHEPATYAALSADEKYRIYLCAAFWDADPDNRAVELVGLASMIYYNTSSPGGGPGATPCLQQFVSELGGVQIDFAGACVSPGAMPTEAFEDGGARELELDFAVDGVEQVADPSAALRVPTSRVSCASYPASYPVIQRIGTTDPVGALRTATGRAIELLDAAIARVDAMRARIAAGEATSVVDQPLADLLWRRLRLRPRRRQAWLESGPGSVGLVLRWLRNLRDLVGGGHLKYTCLDSQCGRDTWAWVYRHDPVTYATLSEGQRYRIYLCAKFWGGDVDNRALTLIHEASHIYYDTEDRGGGPGAAECLSQFVGDLAGIPVDAAFATRCRPPTGPTPTDAFDDGMGEVLDASPVEHAPEAHPPCGCQGRGAV